MVDPARRVEALRTFFGRAAMGERRGKSQSRVLSDKGDICELQGTCRPSRRERVDGDNVWLPPSSFLPPPPLPPPASPVHKVKPDCMETYLEAS